METLPVPTQPLPPAATQEPAHRRKGRIARLPKPLRLEINTMLDDGVSYPDIIQKLQLQAHHINEMCLSRWKDGGYRDWERNMLMVAAVQAKAELAVSIAEQAGQRSDAGQAVLQILATNICEFLVDTDPTELRESLLSDADKFTRFVNAMVRLAEGGIKCALHKNRQDDRATELAKAKAPPQTRGVTEESLTLAENKLNLM